MSSSSLVCNSKSCGQMEYVMIDVWWWLIIDTLWHPTFVIVKILYTFLKLKDFPGITENEGVKRNLYDNDNDIIVSMCV